MRKLLAGLALVPLAGCGIGANDERGRGDASVGERFEEPRDVYVMPDGYSNVSVFCDGTSRVYVTREPVPVYVVPDSPQCEGEPG